MKKMTTPMTEQLKISYPIIVAPMFLVSNEDLVVEASNSGAIGTFPALNFRPIERYHEALKTIRSRTKNPIGINIIVNKSNVHQEAHLRGALEQGVELFITSLGNPKKVIEEAHKNGAKVYCDVTNLEHAKKVQDLGADGVIAVGAGAGGHAGPIPLTVLVPWLARELRIPVIAAGGIAHGSQILSCLALGAAGVSVGTRFIASTEASVDSRYKEAVVKASPEDIVMTTRISGTPATVINSDYIKKIGLDLPWILKVMKDQPTLKKWIVPLIHYLGMKKLEASAQNTTWKDVWSAGQSVGLIDSIEPTAQIIHNLIQEYQEALKKLPSVND